MKFMRYIQISTAKRRLAIAVFISVGGALSLSDQSCFAGGHSHGPIYKTLDALAGGIEKVIDVATKTRGHLSSCDEQSCDDGCDEMMVLELDATSDVVGQTIPEAAPHQLQWPIAVPPEMETPMMEPVMEPIIAPPVAEPVPMPKPMKAPSLPQPVNRQLPVQPKLVQPQPVQAKPLQRKQEQPKADLQPRAADDEWLDSFSTEPAAKGTTTSPRSLPTPPANQGSSPRALRSPAETYDSLPNPFMDDPQSNNVKKSSNQPASYWQPW